MAEFETFGEWLQAVENAIAQTWMANGGSLSYDPINPGLGVGHVMRDNEEEGWEVREARMDLFTRLMDFVWADGANPLNALKRLLVLTRCGSPMHLAWMEQNDVAKLLNETRAATSAREIALWQDFIVKKGFFKGSKRPLMKSESAKATYAARAAANVNRVGGKRARKKFSVLRLKSKKAKPTTKPPTTTPEL